MRKMAVRFCFEFVSLVRSTEVLRRLNGSNFSPVNYSQTRTVATVVSNIVRVLQNIFMGKTKFYAVRRGRNKGIYKSWDECRRQVEGYSKAEFKSFGSEDDAWQFVNAAPNEPTNSKDEIEVVPLGNKAKDSFKGWTISTNSQKSASSVQPTEDWSGELNHLSRLASIPWDEIPSTCNVPDTNCDEDSRAKTGHTFKNSRHLQKHKRQLLKMPSTTFDRNSISVYTDGACEANGRRGAKAGIGVYWGPQHRLNISEPLKGRQTNNRAEIHAAVTAIKQAKNEGLKSLNIHTDSQFLINGVTRWMPKWKKNGWKLSTGSPVKNREDFEDLDNAQSGITIHWVYVKGHAGNAGNEAADRLAKAGVS